MIIGDVSVGQNVLHPISGGFLTRDGNFERTGDQIAYPFAMDVVSPARIDQTVEGALDQNIAQVEGIENAGIVDRDGRFTSASSAF